MNALQRKFKELMKAAKAFLTLPDRIHRYTREFVEQGGMSIETQYTYQAPDHSQHDILYRTSIQLDGDVINFLPDPDLFADDPQWDTQLQEYAAQHFLAVRQFYQELDGIRKIGLRITQMVGSLVGTLSALLVEVNQEIQQLLAPVWMPLADIHPFLVNVFWFLLVSVGLGVAGGVVFFYLLKPALFKLIMRSVKRKMGK